MPAAIMETILMGLFLAFCFIGMFRAERNKGQKLKTLPAVEAIREGIARAVEMGRPVLYHFGAIDVVNYQRYIAPALGILNEVAKVSGKLGAHLITATYDPPTLQLVEEVVRSGYVAVGRDPNEMDNRFVPQGGYTPAVIGIIEREKVGAHFLMGSTMQEVITICESAARTGAFQVSGSPATWQLPMMIASCDYVLMGEEFSVAGSVLADNISQLGTVVGLDWSKAVILGLVVVGTLLAQMGIFRLWGIL
jgi:hypothetical protein